MDSETVIKDANKSGIRHMIFIHIKASVALNLKSQLETNNGGCFGKGFSFFLVNFADECQLFRHLLKLALTAKWDAPREGNLCHPSASKAEFRRCFQVVLDI